MPPGRPKIDPVRDRATLLDHPTRRAIARACRQRPCSVGELEKAARKRSLKKMVDTMERWEILKRVGPASRGKPQFALARGWSGELDAAIARNASTALNGQTFVVLAQPGLASAAQCLAREHADDLSWVGVLGQREGLLISFEEDGDASASKIEETLRGSGIECELRPVDSAASGAEIAPFLRGFGAEGGAAEL
jgi:hypothetical protein